MKNICHKWQKCFFLINDNVPSQILCQNVAEDIQKCNNFSWTQLEFIHDELPGEIEDKRQTLMLQSENRLTRENNVIMDEKLSKHLRRTAHQREELQIKQTSHDANLFCRHLANNHKSA